MKFYTLILSSLVASSALAFDFFDKKVSESDFFITGLSKECQNDINNISEFKECLHVNVNKDNHVEVCKQLYSDKCKKFYGDPMSYTPNCAKDTKIIDEFSMIDLYLASNKHLCQLDSKGDICPSTEATLNNERIDDKTLENVCKSKICTNNFKNLLFESLKNTDKVAALYPDRNIQSDETKINLSLQMEYLRSDKCTNLATDNILASKFIYEESGSDRITISIFTILNLLLLLLLL